MYQIKTFCGGLSEVEDQVNSFLKMNYGEIAEVISVMHSSDMKPPLNLYSNEDALFTVITVTYRSRLKGGRKC